MKKKFELDKLIHDIDLSGLKGRMALAPSTSSKDRHINILFFHGHHSSIERLTGVVELLQGYGNVCLPDMPGFGGMDHFYSIGIKPNIDAYADYMAAIVKLQYGKKKKFIAVGYSFGVLVLTRMLQKYPELQKRVILVVSIAGFVHNSAFLFSKNRKMYYTLAAHLFRPRITSWMAREVFFRRWFLGSFYAKTHNAKVKFAGLSPELAKRAIDFEIKLWRINHLPSHCRTSLEMFRADLLSSNESIDCNVVNIAVDSDHYFDNNITEQHLAMIYERVKVYIAPVDRHGMSIIGDAKDARQFIPEAVLRQVRSLR